ncbi:9577_t:CDS:2, partial [Entrophospora sp. SA101]
KKKSRNLIITTEATTSQTIIDTQNSNQLNIGLDYNNIPNNEQVVTKKIMKDLIRHENIFRKVGDYYSAFVALRDGSN